MMYLTEVNLVEQTKKQYIYKLRAHYGIFTSLLITQLIALGFSFFASGSSGTGTNGMMIYVDYYTGNTIIAFTMLWGFISGVSMNSKLVRDGDFSFVTNRLTSHLSSMAFLLTATVVGGIMAMLGSSLLKGIIFVFRNDKLISNTYELTPSELLLGLAVSVLYVTLFAAIGYFIAGLVQLNRLFIFLIPAFIIGGIFIEARTNGQGPLAEVIKFFGAETSFFMFVVKVLAVVATLLYLTIVLSNKTEVRR